MARAVPELERDYEEKMFSQGACDDVDSDIEEHEVATTSAVKAKDQNGYVTAMDRYGFCGGEQYTDPEAWVQTRECTLHACRAVQAATPLRHTAIVCKEDLCT